MWEEFTELRRGQVAEYTLLKREITLQENNIILPLSNPIEEPLLQGIRDSLLSYLRDKLDNRSLMVEGTFEESGNTKKIPYTTKEKFDYWAAQNPDLLKLKEKLGLDTDF